MIVIKSIDYYQFDGDMYKLLHALPPQGLMASTKEGNIHVPADRFVELVKGRMFVRPDGEQVVIGASKQAQKVIGLQYEAWGTLIYERDEAYTDLRTATKLKRNALVELGTLKDAVKRGKVKRVNASIWTRLNWLLFGYSGG